MSYTSLFLCLRGINSEVKYSLLAGDGGYFSLDEFSGILRLERPLSSDTPPTFELKVKATDRGLPRHLYSVATVTVDVVSLDDYQPVFLKSEYTAQLLESLEVGSDVLSVSALTRDGGGPDPVVYRIVSGNEDDRFLLDSRTGECVCVYVIYYGFTVNFHKTELRLISSSFTVSVSQKQLVLRWCLCLSENWTCFVNKSSSH